MLDLPRKLLELAGACGADGGAGVVRVLRAQLRRAVLYDGGELALLEPAGLRRFPLDDTGEALAGEDLLRRLVDGAEPIRLDHLAELAAYPETLERLSSLGLQSLLAVPLSTGAAQGGLVLARRHGWAFVAAPLAALVPWAAMAGLCLGRALELSTARAELAALKRGAWFPAAAEPDGPRGQIERQQQEALSLRRERDALAERLRELEARLACAEAAEPAPRDSSARPESPTRSTSPRRRRGQATSKATSSDESPAPPGEPPDA